MPIEGSFIANVFYPASGKHADCTFLVSNSPELNLLGRTAIKTLDISVYNLLFSSPVNTISVSGEAKPNLQWLQKKCETLGQQYGDVFKQELGVLWDYELEIEFKPDAKPVFKKPRSVPFAMLEDLSHALDAGITKGIWTPTQFCDWGTPVVPVRKAPRPDGTASIRICGDYSLTVNPQLEVHRHPLPSPEDLMRRLGGGAGFTKIDLADAYNQIRLAPESRKRLALSTHRGVLLQNVMPFGISSAPGHFQQIVDESTRDLPGVAVYLDDILVSGSTVEEHFRNLQHLLKRLENKGLRCRKSKCLFAQPRIEYFGHVLTSNGIAKSPKVDAVIAMPPPTDVASLRSFLGSVQFYSKFLPSNFSTFAEPLYRLVQSGVAWTWSKREDDAFTKLKSLLLTDTVLAHFDASVPIGIACDASNVGIGATLFHRFPDGSERANANVSKTLSKSQRNYSQIQKEALAIIFALKKFYQFLFGRKFILVTDHKPLIAMFGPHKGIPSLAVNRLARWALFLSQFEYDIEYRKTKDYANADALSRLPSGGDVKFDKEESEQDVDIICTIKLLSRQVTAVVRFVREGWRVRATDDAVENFRKLSSSLTTSYGCLL